jgi:hypothetical protein
MAEMAQTNKPHNNRQLLFLTTPVYVKSQTPACKQKELLAMPFSGTVYNFPSI